MHELSLIQSLISSVSESAEKNSITRVTRVRLVMGEAHGAISDALNFAFQALTGGTVCDGALLEVEERLLLMKCGRCRREFNWREHGWFCPGCGGLADVIAGRELYIDFFEGEEGKVESHHG